VYWLEQFEADVPPENDWLGTNEMVYLRGLRFAKRRADWRLGRWTAKLALSACLDVPHHPQVFRKIEIRPEPSGAPTAFFADQPVALTISLSHRSGIAVCAVTMSGAEMGCDLEMVEPRSDAFIADYFTCEEQALIARTFAADRPRLLALLWSAKESALKALREGLRLDTRSVVVRPFSESCDRNGWSRMLVCCPGSRDFHGWWQLTNNVLRTVVAAPPPDSPILLTAPAHCFDSASQCA